MLLRLVLFVLIAIASLDGYAQKDLQSAQKEIALFNYSKAIELLQKTLKNSKGNAACEATLLLADCYRMQNDAANACIWYKKAIGNDYQGKTHKTPETEVFYHYAQVLRTLGEYQEARKFFLTYDSLDQSQSRGRFYAACCDSAIRWQTATPEFKISNMKPLNSLQSEFGPVPYHKGIIFASDRVVDDHENKKYGWTGNNYLNLFFTEPVDPEDLTGDFNKPGISTDIPHTEWHEGPVTFNSTFNLVFINQTQLNRDKGKKDTGRIRTHLLKIFASDLIGGKWSKPEPFFLNSDDYSVGHPALSPDGNTICFVSDMPGGYGETDIWICRKEGNGWSKPVNAGPEINTAGKEMFPFLAGNGDLFFASDGLPGFGGLDLFVARIKDNQWIIPRNLGLPVNSSYDDFSLVFLKDTLSGMFSSNRPGGSGNDDLYSFRKIRVAKKSPPEVISQVPVTIHMDTLKINKTYRLENIFYNFDKWDIREDAKPSLDNLVKIMMEYPVSVELGSHTDCRGTGEYNLLLSQRRAESAVQYIISCGISGTRITAKGYGETQLLNRCNCENGSVCSEKEHQYNRRTEFKIIKVTSVIQK